MPWRPSARHYSEWSGREEHSVVATFRDVKFGSDRLKERRNELFLFRPFRVSDEPDGAGIAGALPRSSSTGGNRRGWPPSERLPAGFRLESPPSEGAGSSPLHRRGIHARAALVPMGNSTAAGAVSHTALGNRGRRGHRSFLQIGWCGSRESLARTGSVRPGLGAADREIGSPVT